AAELIRAVGTSTGGISVTSASEAERAAQELGDSILAQFYREIGKKVAELLEERTKRPRTHARCTFEDVPLVPHERLFPRCLPGGRDPDLGSLIQGLLLARGIEIGAVSTAELRAERRREDRAKQAAMTVVRDILSGRSDLALNCVTQGSTWFGEPL